MGLLRTASTSFRWNPNERSCLLSSRGEERPAKRPVLGLMALRRLSNKVTKYNEVHAPFFGEHIDVIICVLIDRNGSLSLINIVRPTSLEIKVKVPSLNDLRVIFEVDSHALHEGKKGVGSIDWEGVRVSTYIGQHHRDKSPQAALGAQDLIAAPSSHVRIAA